MRIAIEVAGFSPAELGRRSAGRWGRGARRREMEKLHRRFVDGCLRPAGMTEDDAEELFRQVAAFASFGFAKSHAAAFARTAYESAFLKLFYPAQFLVGLINAQPMGFYPVEVLVNDAKRHGVAVLPVDVNASAYRTTTEWVGGPAGRWRARPATTVARRDPASRCRGIGSRPARPGPLAGLRHPVRRRPAGAGRPRAPTGWGVRLGPAAWSRGSARSTPARLDAELARGPYREPGRRGRADRPARGGGRAADPGRRRWTRSGGPRRELLWQLREVAGASGGRVDGRTTRSGRASLEARRGTADRPAPPCDTGARAPADRRDRAARRRLRGDRARRPTPGRRRCSGRHWTGSGR